MSEILESELIAQSVSFKLLFHLLYMHIKGRKPLSASVPEHQWDSSLAQEMLHTVTRSACSTGHAHTFLNISNINEAALAVNSQHVACKLKGNCTRAAPPNLPLSSSDNMQGVCRVNDGARTVQTMAIPGKFYQTWLNLRAEYVHRSTARVLFHDKCDRIYATLACTV